MPQFEVELSDGTIVELEASKQPTQEEVIAALKPLPTSAGGAFGRALAAGIGPSAAAAAAFEPSAALGLPLAEAFPPAPLITGVLGSAIAGGAAALGQRKLMETLAPEFAEKFARLERSDIEQHPVASMGGRLLSMLPSAEVSLPRTLKEVGQRGALQSGLLAGQTVIGEGRLPTLPELGEAAVAGATFGRPRFSLPVSLPRSMQAAGIQPMEVPDASRIQETAKVHGDLLSQSQQGAGQVPTQEGGAGVQPQARPVAQAAQVPLSAEVQDLLRQGLSRNRDMGIGTQLHVLPSFGAADPKNLRPFRAQTANENGTPGRILMSRKAFELWMGDLKDLTPEQRAETVHTALAEEGIHATVKPSEALSYWDTLTGPEQSAIKKLYLGKRSEAEVGMSPELWGHEALRQRMQRLLGMKPTELAEAVGKEKWTRRSLEVLANIIRRMREFFGTRAAGAGQEAVNGLLDRYSKNIDEALKATGEEAAAAEPDDTGFYPEQVATAGPEEPFSLRRKKIVRGYEFDPDIPDENVQVLVSKLRLPNGKEANYVQTDGIEGDENTWSLNPDLMREAGHDIPTTQEILDNVPSGRYRLPEIRRMVAGDEEHLRATALDPRTGSPLSATESLINRLEPGAMPGTIRRSVDELKPGDEVSYNDRSLVVAGWEPEEGQKHSGFLRMHLPGDPSKYIRVRMDARDKMNATRPGPATVRRGKLTPEQEAAEPMLGGMAPTKGKGVLSQPEKAPALETLTQAEAARYEPVTAGALEQTASQYVAQADPIDFQEFSGAATTKFGPLKPGQLRDVYQDAVWKRLMGASGAELQGLVRSAGLTKRLKLETPSGEMRQIPEPPPRMKTELQPKLPVPGLTRPHFTLPARGLYGPYDVPFKGRTTAASRAQFTKSQQLRARVIASLAEKFLSESEEGGRKFLARKEVDPVDDLADTRQETKEPVYNTITSEDHKDPDHLGRILTEDARAFGGASLTRVEGGQKVTVKQKGFPVSATKRLSVIQNRETGKVSLVSTFRDGRRGPVILDPQAPGATHSPVDSIIKRYRVLASVLLDEPVQKFRQDFKDIATFEDEFGRPARDAANRLSGYEAPPAEGEAIVPQRTIRQLDQPLTPEEALGIIDHLEGETGTFESPADVRQAIEALKEHPTGEVVNAYSKLANEIQRKNPDLTTEQVLDRLGERLYEIYRTAQNSEEYVSRTVAEGPAGDREAARLALQTKPAEPAQPTTPGQTGQELTMRERIPPTVDPTTELGKRLAQAHQPKPVPSGEHPAVIRRTKESIAAETVRLGHAVRALIRRKDVSNAIAAARDAADNIGNTAGDQADQHIRGVTAKGFAGEPFLVEAGKTVTGKNKLRQGNKQVLSGANALIAAGAIKPNYHWTLTLRQKLNAHMQADPRMRTANMLISSATPADQAAGWKMLSDARTDATRRLIFDGDLPAQAPSYSFDPTVAAELNRFGAMVQRGAADAQALSSRPGALDRYRGRVWLKGAQDLKAELDYAAQHWGEADLVETATAMRRELDAQYDRERVAGSRLRYDENYLPGRYDGELFDDNAVVFGGGKRVLGKMWRSPKTFESYYHAIEAGPYVALTRDGAAIIGHRVRQGERSIQYRQWVEALKGFTDPDTGKPVAVNAIQQPGGGFSAPDTDHVVMYPRKGGAGIAVRKGFEGLVRSLTSDSIIHDWAPSRFALEWSQRLKHTILMGDFFHLARMGYYATSIMGRKSAYRGGLAAIEFREADLPRAVANGIVSPKAAAWASERLPVMLGQRPAQFSRSQIGQEFLRLGLNVGKIQDALYKDLVRSVPLAGAYNKWLFDKFTRGLMMQTAVQEFERLHKANPNIDAFKLIRDISRDTNNYFGSIGRQGWFKAPWLQDLTRMVFLAPQWVEGLVMKEAGFAARAGALPGRLVGLNYREGLPPLGTLGKGIGQGLIAMVVLTQAINLLSRRKPTWQNEEKGHQLDAWVPSLGEGEGFWFSPLAVFNELAHDIVRLGEAKPKFWDALNQIGHNKLGPYGRLALVLATSRTPTQEYISTTGGVAKEGAKQLLPVPISFGRVMQAGAHALAPETIPATQPGAVQRQAMATLGLKMEPKAGPAQEISQLARAFKEAAGKRETIHIEPVLEEPSYAKLRQALRNNDQGTAKKVLQQLEAAGKKDPDIIKAMKAAARHPFTGSRVLERQFKDSLDDRQLDLYTRAVQQKEEEYQQFLDWFRGQ